MNDKPGPTKKSRSPIALILALFVFAGAGVAVWRNWPKPPLPTTPDVPLPQTFNQVLKDLADQTKAKLGEAEDFTVVVTENAMPIGTVLRVGSTVPVEDTACLPAKEPNKTAAPSFTPQIKLSRNLAGAFGLNDLVPILGGAKMGAERNDELELSFMNTGYRLLSDNGMKDLLDNPSCRRRFGMVPRWVVRGYVIGQRRLVLTNVRDNTIAGDIAEISNFEGNANGKYSVEMVDAAEAPFIQLISRVDPPATPDAVPQIAAVQAEPPSGAGVLYIQKDKSDATDVPQLVARALKDGGLRANPRVENIATEKMPRFTQVRYFNDADRPTAERAAAVIKSRYPDVRIVRIGLPAPSGQLEVWLTRQKQ